MSTAETRITLRIAEEIVAEIGNGFVMDDYRMECPVETLIQS